MVRRRRVSISRKGAKCTDSRGYSLAHQIFSPLSFTLHLIYSVIPVSVSHECETPWLPSYSRFLLHNAPAPVLASAMSILASIERGKSSIDTAEHQSARFRANRRIIRATSGTFFAGVTTEASRKFRPRGTNESIGVGRRESTE